jgi:hypothetical protein
MAPSSAAPVPGRNRLRVLRSFVRAPASVQLIVLGTFMVTLWLCTNWVYQVVRKPTELLFPVSGALTKTPPQTWQEYSPIFKDNATRVVTPQLLAALAQVEASGNPLVRTYWRWSWIAKPFEIYKPASSAVGMYQMTDSTFAEAKHYCIRDHAVVHDDSHQIWHACPFTELYSRLVPSHSVEMTSAYLDVHVASILARHPAVHATARQKQDLAAVIHLCGAGAADLYVQHGFQFATGERCGDHDPRGYLARVDAMKAVFARLDAQDQRSAAHAQWW